MRVLHVRASNFFGGPEKQILGQARAARAHQVETIVVSFLERGRECELVARARELGTVAYSVDCVSAYDPRQVTRLRRLLGRTCPDVVCTHDYRSTTLARIALYRLRIPHVAFWRGVTKEGLKVSLYYWLEQRFLRAVDHVVVVSGSQRSFLLVQGLPAHGVSLVPNSVDVVAGDGVPSVTISSLVEGAEGRTLLATAGRLSAEKGHAYLIEAMPRLIAARDDILLLVFGQGPMLERLQALAARLKCTSHVRFLGFVDDFASLVKSVNVFVLPSLSEGLPNVLLEAMAAARPIVATRAGGVVDVIRHEENGLLVAPGDSAALAAGILRLVSDAGLATRLADSAREAVRNSYSFEAQAEQLIKIYTELTGKRKTAVDSPHLFISVVVPVLEEAEFLESVLQELTGQSYPAQMFEVLVVDGGSTDDTISVARGFSGVHSNVHILDNPARLSSAGRNVGARAAKGDVVLFVDGHCEIPDPRLLENLNRVFQDTRADVACRPQPLETAGMTAVQTAIAAARACPIGHNPWSHIFATEKEGFVDPESSGAAYRRAVFERIGYFDESFDACEDVDFNLRAGGAGLRAFTSPSLTVRYRPRDDMASLFHQMLRYGAGRARLFLKHRGGALAGPLLLGIPGVLVALLAVLSGFSETARFALLSVALAYVAVVAAASVSVSWKRGAALVPLVFLALVVTHAGLAAGFWKGLLAGRTRPEARGRTRPPNYRPASYGRKPGGRGAGAKIQGRTPGAGSS